MRSDQGAGAWVSFLYPNSTQNQTLTALQRIHRRARPLRQPPSRRAAARSLRRQPRRTIRRGPVRRWRRARDRPVAGGPEPEADARNGAGAGRARLRTGGTIGRRARGGSITARGRGARRRPALGMYGPGPAGQNGSGSYGSPPPRAGPAGRGRGRRSERKGAGNTAVTAAWSGEQPWGRRRRRRRKHKRRGRSQRAPRDGACDVCGDGIHGGEGGGQGLCYHVRWERRQSTTTADRSVLLTRARRPTHAHRPTNDHERPARPASALISFPLKTLLLSVHAAHTIQSIATPTRFSFSFSFVCLTSYLPTYIDSPTLPYFMRLVFFSLLVLVLRYFDTWPWIFVLLERTL
ncbi:hypothetical protein B0H14DRAFT_1636782 [Mycena olivaceomarginata]|nr:hypothetical protein B0H14DRAFT_1636782 [Mycena olivaceomarginata]